MFNITIPIVLTIFILHPFGLNNENVRARNEIVFTIVAINMNTNPGPINKSDGELYNCKANSIVPIKKLIMAMDLLVVIKLFIGVFCVSD
ncbi:hypothetical protein GCM10011368_30940 [Hyunsoonleella pacifica]|nr:hypothetical protein GCM10011368_30940 [Hyunsoonleella pacifica]